MKRAYVDRDAVTGETHLEQGRRLLHSLLTPAMPPSKDEARWLRLEGFRRMMEGGYPPTFYRPQRRSIGYSVWGMPIKVAPDLPPGTIEMRACTGDTVRITDAKPAAE